MFIEQILVFRTVKPCHGHVFLDVVNHWPNCEIKF